MILRQTQDKLFVYKHPKTKQWTPVRLQVFEFLRRFLQHVLPQGFKKIRHYGFLNSKYKAVLTTLQYALGTVEVEPAEDHKPKKPCCPICGKEMLFMGILTPDYFRQPVHLMPP